MIMMTSMLPLTAHAADADSATITTTGEIPGASFMYGVSAAVTNY